MGRRRHCEGQEGLTEQLATEGSIQSEPVKAAFRTIDRKMFLPGPAQDDAYDNSPVRHGLFHQSAPSVYGSALEALDLKPGLSFLNIGSGTGYLSALVSTIIGPQALNMGIEQHEAKSNIDASRSLPEVGHKQNKPTHPE